MRAPIITEQLITPASLRPTASSMPSSFICKRRSSSKKALWDLSFCEGGSIKTCLLLLFGLLLCFSFILAMCCTLDAACMSIHASKRSPQVSRLLNIGRFNNLGHNRIKHIGHASPTHTHVGDTTRASTTYNKEAALHGLGVVFSKGTKCMQNLIIANLEESCDMLDFRLFLRTLYRSGAMARADLVLLFPWSSLPQAVSEVLQEEDISFKKLITMSLQSPTPSSNGNNISVFDAHAFEALSNMKDEAKRKDEKRVIMWGSENSTPSVNHEDTHLIDFEYGSVVGFHMNELDSTDAFSDFLINPSSQLRRWLCYQMLLGLLRFKFRLAMLVELGGVVILDDVFSQAKKKDFLYLSLEDSTWADATATVQCNHCQKGERQSPLPRGIQDNDHINSLVLTKTHDDNMQIVPLRHSAGEIAVMKSLDDNEHMVHKTMLSNNKGIRGAPHKRIEMRVDQSKGLVVQRRKHEMMDKRTHNETRDDEGNGSTRHREGERMVRRSEQDAMGRAMGDTLKPNHTRAREQGHVRAKQSLMEMVYGKEAWECLEKGDQKQRRIVNSRVILGSMRSAKGLANTMALEVVKVALQRNSKLSFPDRALLSYLVQKNFYLLGKRATKSLQLMGNGESIVHSVDNSEQRNVFVRPHDGKKYSIVQASSLNVRPNSMHPHQRDQSMMSNLSLSYLIRADICASTADAAALYHDCGLLQ